MYVVITVMLAAVSPPPDSIFGQIRSEHSLTPVPGVHVELLGTGVEAFSDSAGRYVLRDVDNGTRSLRFSRLGYDTLTLDVMLPDGQSMRVDAELTTRPLLLPRLVVVAHPGRRKHRPKGANAAGAAGAAAEEVGLEVVRRNASGHALSLSPDPWVQLLTLPALATRGEYPTSIHVRGGSANENLVLLDGLPLYGLTPVGGAASPITPDLVGAVELHAAAPPAEYGGRLSSVINVLPRDTVARRMTADGGWDAKAIRQSIEVPLPRGAGSVFVSGRTAFAPPRSTTESRRSAGSGISRCAGRSRSVTIPCAHTTSVPATA